jgi:hypothetical protein
VTEPFLEAWADDQVPLLEYPVVRRGQESEASREARRWRRLHTRCVLRAYSRRSVANRRNENARTPASQTSERQSAVRVVP